MKKLFVVLVLSFISFYTYGQVIDGPHIYGPPPSEVHPEGYYETGFEYYVTISPSSLIPSQGSFYWTLESTNASVPDFYPNNQTSTTYFKFTEAGRYKLCLYIRNYLGVFEIKTHKIFWVSWGM